MSRSTVSGNNAGPPNLGKLVDLESDGFYSALPPRGLSNLGNTCFYNSIMQCIMNTPYMVPYFHALRNRSYIHNSKEYRLKINAEDVDVPVIDIELTGADSSLPINDKLQCFITEFRCNRSPGPKPLFNLITQRVPQFQSYDQQDAHEFLRHFIDQIHEEEIRYFERCFVESSDTGESPSADRLRLLKALIRGGPAAPLIDAVFGGLLLQTIRCSFCGNVSTCFEPFFDLSLPLIFEHHPNNEDNDSQYLSFQTNDKYHQNSKLDQTQNYNGSNQTTKERFLQYKALKREKKRQQNSNISPSKKDVNAEQPVAQNGQNSAYEQNYNKESSSTSCAQKDEQKQQNQTLSKHRRKKEKLLAKKKKRSHGKQHKHSALVVEARSNSSGDVKEDKKGENANNFNGSSNNVSNCADGSEKLLPDSGVEVHGKKNEDSPNIVNQTSHSSPMPLNDYGNDVKNPKLIATAGTRNEDIPEDGVEYSTKSEMVQFPLRIDSSQHHRSSNERHTCSTDDEGVVSDCDDTIETSTKSGYDCADGDAFPSPHPPSCSTPLPSDLLSSTNQCSTLLSYPRLKEIQGHSCPSSSNENSEFVNGRCNSILAALRKFTSLDTLVGENCYKCEHCAEKTDQRQKANRNKKDKHSSSIINGQCSPYCIPSSSSDRTTAVAHKRYQIHKTPLVLTLHLKRFEHVFGNDGANSYGSRPRAPGRGGGIGASTTNFAGWNKAGKAKRQSAGHFRKYSGFVWFPPTLNIAPFCSEAAQIGGNNKPILYRLYGVVCHRGGMNGGHYIAYVCVRLRSKRRVNRLFLDALRKTGIYPASSDTQDGKSNADGNCSGSRNSNETATCAEIDQMLSNLTTVLQLEDNDGLKPKSSNNEIASSSSSIAFALSTLSKGNLPLTNGKNDCCENGTNSLADDRSNNCATSEAHDDDNCPSTWYRVNDTSVSVCLSEEVFNAEAYLLFYERIE